MSETELGREPVELLELIVPKCANVYGSAPCTASGSGDAKCFNTRATCQDIDNFQETPLAHLGEADLVAEQGDIGSHSLNGQDPYLLEIDLRIPSDPSGLVFEIGGSGTGVYVGFTSGNLVARCGDGSGAPSTSKSNIEIDPSAIEGKQGTLIYEFGLDGSGYPEGTLYFFDPLELELTELGTDTATASTSTFGGGGYGVGTINGSAAGNGTEDETDYNGVITGVRLHASVAASVGTVTGAASNVVTDIGGTDYRVITWTGSGSISINTAISGVEYLVVAGGGGGGNNGGGGGGAGGLLTNVGGATVTLGTGSNTIQLAAAVQPQWARHVVALAEIARL